jgi:hypothetical protein
MHRSTPVRLLSARRSLAQIAERRRVPDQLTVTPSPAFTGVSGAARHAVVNDRVKGDVHLIATS